MKTEKMKPKEQITLEPFERDHAVVVGEYRCECMHRPPRRSPPPDRLLPRSSVASSIHRLIGASLSGTVEGFVPRT